MSEIARVLPPSDQVEQERWSPLEALRFYAQGRHFHEEGGCTRLLDSGEVASDALKQMKVESAGSKGLGLDFGLRALDEVSAERARQKIKEGFSSERDDQYTEGELARAAAWYALASVLAEADGDQKELHSWVQRACNGLFTHPQLGWPFSDRWFKPYSEHKNLVRAAALLLAAIEKHHRAQFASGPTGNEARNVTEKGSRRR